MDLEIQSYLRATAGHGRATERVGPFLATFDLGSDHPFFNYAVPADGAEPSAGDVAALTAAYRRRGRTPRLEYLPAVAPAAEAALLAGGFTVEARLPLMTCTPKDLAEPEVPPGVDLVLPVTDGELAASAAVQRAAFGAPPPDPDAGAHLRKTLAAGGILVLARTADTGEPAGAGMCTPPEGGITELVGIGVAERFRRRGIATALTARLAAAAFAAGVTTAFLTPGDDVAGRAYARAGFTATTRMLHLVGSEERPPRHRQRTPGRPPGRLTAARPADHSAAPRG